MDEKIFCLKTFLSSNPFSLIPFLSRNLLSPLPTFYAHLRCSPPSALCPSPSGNPGRLIRARTSQTRENGPLTSRGCCCFVVYFVVGKPEKVIGYQVKQAFGPARTQSRYFQKRHLRTRDRHPFFSSSNSGRLFGFAKNRAAGCSERRSPVGSFAAVCRDGWPQTIRASITHFSSRYFVVVGQTYIFKSEPGNARGYMKWRLQRILLLSQKRSMYIFPK